jgi:hypothetical protein
MTGSSNAPDSLPAPAVLAFAPLHKRAFGTAVGLVTGGVIFLLTVAALYLPEGGGMNLGLMAAFFSGYSISWTGAFIGFGWGCFVGFIAGWFLAFCRNLVLALSLAYLRARMELKATRDILDHI